ncbi:MAG: DNA repair protein RadC [Pseudotabrizicola sp.]|uniref:DNA repair protein RadC n=1 Tax=Pseudotabrizicola sp. TaxID=2939647 RepID=UPI002731C49F|nr:DNA repair protein RadC [Pseudotabrizicola sp.]MDP2081027.1 DNA repair protein RadC [Pseudotabrizicola sp.]MDZ7574870.1 DNA repair protein RadC [Pseudotabrizicola sp.]
MFDLPFPALSTPFPAGVVPDIAQATADPTLPFALTTPHRNPPAAMLGEARPRIIGHFMTLAEAMRGAIKMAEELEPDAGPRMLAILDRDERLVLAGAAANGAVAWCAPVMTATEARVVVMEASQLRAQASRAADWQESDLATRLRQRADLLEARLADPLWRAFAAHALQIAA